jgi:hypothetical protein
MPAADPDATFDMDPDAAIIETARLLVLALRGLSTSRRAARSLPPDAGRDVVASHTGILARLQSEQIPTLAANFALALEVRDTFGSGRQRIDDPTDAALWNNKWFVWFKEFQEAVSAL